MIIIFSKVLTYIPFLISILFGVGLFLLVRSSKERLTSSQLRRLHKLYAYTPSESTKKKATKRSRFSLSAYKRWVRSSLVRIGYAERIDQFYSLVRMVFIFMYFSGFGLSFLSGFTLLSSIYAATFIGIFSLVIPHLILWYLVKRHLDLLNGELSVISGYIFDAVSGSNKDLYTAIDESINLIRYLSGPMVRFLNRYRTEGIEAAGNGFITEVPIPEAEQFVFLISNGFEYQDQASLTEYIQVTSQARHNLWISSRKRREQSRDQLFTLLSVTPAILVFALIYFTMYTRMVSVMSQTIQ